MNKKFLSTLLTVAAASLTLNAAPVAKAKAKVVEVEMAPAKLIEVKISPVKAINEGTIDLAAEMGYGNFAGELSGSWLYSRSHNFFSIPKASEYIPANFNHTAYKLNVNAIYYAKENRRTGLYWYLGGAFTLGKNAVNQLDGDYKKAEDNFNYALTVHAGIGHKVELYDFLFVSNSIELPSLLWFSPSIEDKSTAQAKADAMKAARTSSLLNNFRVNLLEVRFAF